MGYRIVYGEDPFVGESAPKSRLRPLTAAFALAFVILVRCTWPQGSQILRQLLLPQTDGTGAAFQQMAQEIRAGEPVGEAVTAFCRGIVEDAFAQTD